MIGNSSSLPPPQYTPCPRACQLDPCANPHPTIVLEPKTTFTHFRNRLINLASRNWPTLKRRDSQTTTLTAPCRHLHRSLHAPSHVPFAQRRFTTPRSDQTPVPEPALQPHLRGASTHHDPLPPTDLQSVQTLVQGLPQTPLREQPAAVHSAPTAVSAPVRLPVQLFARLHVAAHNAPTGTPQSALAAGVATPRRTALRNYGRRSPPACLRRCSYSRRKLKFLQPGAILKNHNHLRCDGSAHLGQRRVHTDPNCVAARWQARCANLHPIQYHFAGSPHRRRAGMGGYASPIAPRHPLAASLPSGPHGHAAKSRH